MRIIAQALYDFAKLLRSVNRWQSDVSCSWQNCPLLTAYLSVHSARAAADYALP